MGECHSARGELDAFVCHRKRRHLKPSNPRRMSCEAPSRLPGTWPCRFLPASSSHSSRESSPRRPVTPADSPGSTPVADTGTSAWSARAAHIQATVRPAGPDGPRQFRPSGWPRAHSSQPSHGWPRQGVPAHRRLPPPTHLRQARRIRRGLPGTHGAVQAHRCSRRCGNRSHPAQLDSSRRSRWTGVAGRLAARVPLNDAAGNHKLPEAPVNWVRAGIGK